MLILYLIFCFIRFKYLLENSEKYVLKKRSLAPEETNNLLLQISNDANFVLNDEKSIWKIFFNVLFGKEDFVCRSANIVQVLGSVTVSIFSVYIFIFCIFNSKCERILILLGSVLCR